MKRTIVMQSRSEELYMKTYRWLSLQNCEIEEEVRHKKIVASEGVNTRYIVAGLALTLVPPFVFGVLWFVLARNLARRRISIHFEESPEGTYLIADLIASAELYNQLVAVLSMTDGMLNPSDSPAFND